MFRNLLKTALRNIWRHKAQSGINILGLSVGLACSFLIALWVQDELSFNEFHAEKDQLYRVMRHATFGGVIGTNSSVPKPLDEVLDAQWVSLAALSDYDVDEAVRMGVHRVTGSA